MWVPSGSAEFYLGGTEDSLWPQYLTSDNIGLIVCMDPSTKDSTCLHGGLEDLKILFDWHNGYLNVVSPEKIISDKGIKRSIVSNVPIANRD